jgi:hypothetical protein
MSKVVCTFLVCVTFLIAFCLWLAADRHEVITDQTGGAFQAYQFDKWTGRSWYINGEVKVVHPWTKEAPRACVSGECVSAQEDQTEGQ